MSAPTSAAPLDAPALLRELDRRGVRLDADGGRLRYDAPRGAVGDLLPELARLKPELLALLQSARPSAELDRAPDAAGGTAPDAPAWRRVPSPPERARPSPSELLASYRSAGARLWLEEVEAPDANGNPARWLALAYDLSGVASAKRPRALRAIDRNARALQTALEAEKRAKL